MKLLRSISTVTFIILVLPASTNYKLRDFSFGAGGSGESSSANYDQQSLTGEEFSDKQAASLNYLVGPGLLYTQQANIPAAPTFTNPSDYYNQLKFVINPSGNPSDATFAIAISDDNFVTTKYIKSDNLIGDTLTNADYKTYAAWGGAAGANVLGLRPNTSYKIKVKARQGKFTETDWGPTATATTNQLNITLTFEGVASGTSVAGIITDITTQANSVTFSELPFDQTNRGAQKFTLTTNALGGYTLRTRQEGNLVNATAAIFPAVSTTNASPGAFPGSTLTGAYGYHTTDATLGTGNTTRFAADDTYAKFETSNLEVAYQSVPVTNDITNIVYSILVGKGQPPGEYTHTVTYTAVAIW